MAGRSRKLGRSLDARRILGLRSLYSSLAYFQNHRAWLSSSRRVLRSLSQLLVAASAADALLVLATAGSGATQRAANGVGSVLYILSGIGKAIETFVVLSDLGYVSSDAYKSYLRAQRAANTAQSCRQQLLQHDFELPKALMQAFEVADKFHIGSFVSSPSLNEIASVRSSRSALRAGASDRPTPMPRYILDTLASLQQQLISFQGGFRSESQESVRSSQPAKSSIDASALGSEDSRRGRASQQAGLGIYLLAKEFGTNLEAYLLAYHRWTSLRARIVRLALASVSGLSTAVVEAADAMSLLQSASYQPAARSPQQPSSAHPLASNIASSTGASGSRLAGWTRHLPLLARCVRIAALAIGPTAGIALLVLRARDAAASASGGSRSSRGPSSSSSYSRRSKSSGSSRGVTARGSAGRSSPTKTRTGSRRRNSGKKYSSANRKQDAAFAASGHSREIGGLEAARLQAAPASGAAGSAGAGAGASASGSVAHAGGQSLAEQPERLVSASTGTAVDHRELSNKRATGAVTEGVPPAPGGRPYSRSQSGSVSYTRPAPHAGYHGRALASGLATSGGSYRGSGATQHGAVATTEFGMAVLSETVEDEDEDEDGDGSTAGMDSGSQRTPLSAVGQYSGPPLTSHLSAASLSKLR